MSGMLSGRRSRAAFALLAMVLLPNVIPAQNAPRQQGEIHASAKALIAQLGVKMPPRDDDEFGLGVSISGTLESPEKLARFGITGVHQGARVTIMRIAPDKVRVEADELDPTPARAAATLRLSASGTLLAAS